MKHISRIQVDPQSRHETLDNMTREYPYQALICDPHDFAANTCPWHWHRELEIFYIREGSLEYHLPGKTYVFEAGEGGFLNSNVLHETICKTEGPCVQELQQFAPELIGGFAGSLISRKYVLPLVEMPGPDIIKLSPEQPEHRPLLNEICNAFEACKNQQEGYELEIQQALFAFWKGLYLLASAPRQREIANPGDQRIKQMLSFISAHYGEHLTLEDIAASAYMNTRACGRCFQSQLGTTPMTYLIEFRIQKACELLTGSELPIGTVAMECGFGSNSYFGRIFLEKIGMTPNEYRKQHKTG